MRFLTVMYSCDGCGLVKRKVQVRARTDPKAEDVVTWVRDVVGHAVGRDHSLVSPSCRATTMRDLMIPAQDVEWIGQSRPDRAEGAPPPQQDDTGLTP